MKIDKSLQEVWNWKNEIYKETKSMSMKDFCEYIRQKSKKAKKGLRLAAPSRKLKYG